MRAAPTRTRPVPRSGKRRSPAASSRRSRSPRADVSAQPIGVFDSGIGGLSVLRALRAELPHENFVYFADTAHAPYGEREESMVGRRALDIARKLRETHRIKALVVACN